MPAKRTRSRMRTRKRTMKRSRKKVSKIKSFKSKALESLKTTPTNKIRYATVGFTTTQRTVATKELWTSDLTLIPYGFGENQRLGDTARLKGFRLRMHFTNELLSPLVVNVALLTPRLSGVGRVEDQFFRQLGLTSSSPTERGLDFDDVNLSGISYATLPINTDIYGVVWHTRFKLGVPSTSLGFSSGELKNYRSLYRYVKINRDLQWPKKDAFLAAVENIKIVVWCAGFMEVAGGPQVTGALKFQEHLVAAFDNKNQF